jgi:hypothetical protein
MKNDTSDRDLEKDPAADTAAGFLLHSMSITRATVRSSTSMLAR